MLKKLLVVALIGGIIWACGGGDNSQNKLAKSDKVAEAPAVDGKAVFQKNCVVCHGINGDMGVNGAYNLQNSQLAVEERVNVITNGRNTMAAYKEILSADEITAVAQYTTTLGK